MNYPFNFVALFLEIPLSPLMGKREDWGEKGGWGI